jgi:AraC-like DNA-binding protein
MSLTMPAPADTAHPGDTRTLGVVRVTTYRGAARPIVHAPEAATVPYLLLGLHTTGRATLDRRGTTEVCRPDDLFLCDGAEPFALHQSEDFVLHLVRIPRHALALTDRRVRALTDRAPFADGPVAPLLGSLLRQLAAAPDPSSATALQLSCSIAELVDLLTSEEDLDPGPKAHGQEHGREREALVRRLRAYIDAHLWDRNLTPASVAAAQHISLRYLHRLFEDQDSTVGRWIQHRRLEEARRELARPGRGDITVAAVARRWGFASASHFSRSFRAAYGIAPSDWRDGRTRPSGQTAGNLDV